MCVCVCVYYIYTYACEADLLSVSVRPRVPRGGVTRKRRCTYRLSSSIVCPQLFLTLLLYQGGWGSVWDPEPSTERVGDWGGPATVWSLLCDRALLKRCTVTAYSGFPGAQVQRSCTFAPGNPGLGVCVCVPLLQDLLQNCSRGGGGRVEDMWATSAQRRCHPEEALYLPTFSHLFHCQ